MGDTAISRLTVTGLTGLSAPNAPFDDEREIALCELHLTALRNISNIITIHCPTAYPQK